MTSEEKLKDISLSLKGSVVIWYLANNKER